MMWWADPVCHRRIFDPFPPALLGPAPQSASFCLLKTSRQVLRSQVCRTCVGSGRWNRAVFAKTDPLVMCKLEILCLSDALAFTPSPPHLFIIKPTIANDTTKLQNIQERDVSNMCERSSQEINFATININAVERECRAGWLAGAR